MEAHKKPTNGVSLLLHRVPSLLHRVPLLLLWAAACSGPDDAGGADSAGHTAYTTPSTTTVTSTTSGSGTSTSTSTTTEEHPPGEAAPSFSLVDLNPSSATYNETISSEDLAGAPYGLVFLDSRCPACADVADDLWTEYEARPGWWGALPTFAVESYSAFETSPSTIDEVVDGNDMPYLIDTEDVLLWQNWEALNHDFFAVSADGTLDVWLPMYTWPDDLEMFVEFMSQRYGEGESHTAPVETGKGSG